MDEHPEEAEPLTAEELIEEQERLAAQEAAAIGGRAGDEGVDPAQRPVVEAGGGESEGFELAEADLIRHASHSDDESDTVILNDAGRPEVESDLQTGEFAESDGVGPDSSPQAN